MTSCTTLVHFGRNKFIMVEISGYLVAWARWVSRCASASFGTSASSRTGACCRAFPSSRLRGGGRGASWRVGVLEIVSFGTAVGEGGELGSEAVEVVEVQGCQGVAVAVGARGEYGPPRVHDHAPPVGPAPVGLAAPLRRSYHERLVLDGAGPKQYLPVVLAGLQREGCRDRQDLGSAQRQEAVELREAHVVADRESHGGRARFRRDDLVAGRDVRALQVLFIGDLHVEEVDLPVDRRHLPRRVEERRGIGQPLRAGLALEDRTSEHVYAQLAGQIAQKLRRGTGDGLGVLAVDLVQAVTAPELRQRHELRPGGYSFSDQGFRRPLVLPLIRRGRHLDRRRHQPSTVHKTPPSSRASD